MKGKFEMEEKFSVPRSSFFKIMLPGFHQYLNLPQAFCKKLAEEKLDHATIRTSMGTSKIQVCRNDELGLISFKDGWPDFVRRHGLSVEDFVVFEHTGNFHFEAVMFDTSGCEKDRDSSLVEPKKEPKYNDASTFTMKRKRGKESGVSHKCRNPYFVLTMEPYHARKYSRAWIPINAWRSIRMEDKTDMILRDPRGREWSVRVNVDKCRGQMRCRMGATWRDFYVGNKLKLGDVCRFELVRKKSSNVVVMDVHIFPKPS